MGFWRTSHHTYLHSYCNECDTTTCGGKCTDSINETTKRVWEMPKMVRLLDQLKKLEDDELEELVKNYLCN